VILDNNGEPVAYNVEDWKQEDSNWYIGQLESLGVKVPKQTKLDVMKANEP
jgi:hypothetical protein